MSDFSAVELTGLSKAVASAAATKARGDLAVGTHLVDLVVHISGSLQVAPDGTRVPTASIPVKEVLALFVARSGCTRERGIALLRECLTAALEQGVSGAGAIEAAADVDATFKAAVDELVASLPRTPVKGQVRALLQVKRMEVNERSVAGV